MRRISQGSTSPPTVSSSSCTYCTRTMKGQMWLLSQPVLCTIPHLLLRSDTLVTFPRACMAMIQSGLCSCFAITKAEPISLKTLGSFFTNCKSSKPTFHFGKAEHMFLGQPGSDFRTIRSHKSEAETSYSIILNKLFSYIQL